LRQLILHLPASAQRTNASIQLASRAVAAGVRTQDRQVELTFPEPIQLAPRQILQVQLNW